MQRSPRCHAFSLVEMIAVVSILIVLFLLVVLLAPLAADRQKRARTHGEIVTLMGACEAYQGDNGGYPQDVPASANGASVTNDLDPRVHFSPSSSGTPSYAAASLFLYKQLTGDENANGQIDATETPKKYAPDFFKPSKFDAGFKTSGVVSYFVDPFGYSYGYSTAGLKAEQVYRVNLQANPGASRPSPTMGYNPTFDLWSTGSSTATTIVDQPKWLKNW